MPGPASHSLVRQVTRTIPPLRFCSFSRKTESWLDKICSFQCDHLWSPLSFRGTAVCMQPFFQCRGAVSTCCASKLLTALFSTPVQLMNIPAGIRSSCEHSINKKASVNVAVMASAGSPGGSSAHNSLAWLVVIDEAINHPSGPAHFRPPQGTHCLVFYFSDFLSAP